eukprot:491505-Amphidinium_carterae.1
MAHSAKVWSRSAACSQSSTSKICKAFRPTARGKTLQVDASNSGQEYAPSCLWTLTCLYTCLYQETHRQS